MENPLDICIYDKNFNFRGFVVDPIYYHFVPSWEDQGYGSIDLAADNPHTEAMQAKGARITVRHRGEHVLSGPIRSFRGEFTSQNNSVTYQVLDDRRLLENTLAFVAPNRKLGALSLNDLAQAQLEPGQTQVTGKVVHQSSYYQWPTMTSSEEAIKHIIRINLVERLGRDIQIMPNLGRGGNPTAILPIIRMESLNDAIQPIANFSKLGIRLWQDRLGSRIKMDVIQPGAWPQVLTPESGIVRDGSYAILGPEITRPIVGGPGETAARAWAGVEGTAMTAVEADYNDVIEVFREASAFELDWAEDLAQDLRVAKYFPFRGTTAQVAEFTNFMQRMVNEGVAAGRPKSTLELDLAETETFHFGGPNGVKLGDTVTIRAQGQTFTEKVTEAMLTFTRDNGFTVTPLIGKREDDPDVQLATALANVANALRTIHRRK